MANTGLGMAMDHRLDVRKPLVDLAMDEPLLITPFWILESLGSFFDKVFYEI